MTGRQLIVALGTVLAATWASAQTIPPTLDLEVMPWAGISQPVAVRHAGDGSNRIFVVQKGGAIRLVKNGVVEATPFLQIPVTTSSESGLLGMAFHPNFATNRKFYVAYTKPAAAAPFLGTTPDQAIAEFEASVANPDVADPSTRREIIAVPDLAGNHNGGDIHFGPDGFLYWSMGDGGPQNDPNEFAQFLGTRTISGRNYYMLGKILRIDINNSTPTPTANMCARPAAGAANYAIPPGNPFVATAGACAEIFHYGLRNPFRFSFDRANGAMWIGDVGQGVYEEINRVAPAVGGVNFGWRCKEGFNNNSSTGLCAGATGLTDPVADYAHNSAGNPFRCSVTGGFVYRGPITDFRGIYVYADYCSGEIYMHRPGDDGTRLPFVWRDTANDWSGFGEDEAGNLYIVALGGTVVRFTGPTGIADRVFANGFEN